MKKITSYTCMMLALGLTVGCTSTGAGSKAGQVKDENGHAASQEASSSSSTSTEKEGDPALTLSDADMKGTIKISTYEDDDYIAGAAKLFEKKYPNVHVDVNIFAPIKKETYPDGSICSSSNDDPNLSMDKYITQLNTAFMNGTASDMINLWGLPFYKYAEKGYLYDLKNTVEGPDGLDKSQYYFNIIDAVQYDEGYYSMPFLYSVEFYGVAKTYLDEAGMKVSDLQNTEWNTDEILQYAKTIEAKTGKKHAFSRTSAMGLFMDELRIGKNPYINIKEKKVNIDSPEFIGQLKKVKEISDAGYLGKDDKETLFYSSHELAQPYCDEAYYTPSWNDYSVAWKPYGNEAQGTNMMCYCNYGLNAASKQKALCWAFMKFLYSEEVQSQSFAFADRVNRAAEKASIAADIDGYEKEDGIKLNAPKEEILADWLKRQETCIEAVKGTDLLERSVIIMMGEEVDKYFSGEKTAEEVAKNLQNKINVMFNE